MKVMKKSKSKSESTPLEFLKHAQTDAKTSVMVQAAMKKGAEVTATEVLKIAKSHGYNFTRRQFEQAVKKSYAERFAAGDISVANVLMESKRAPLESTCAAGCLSYTISYCPPPPVAEKG
jgi:hypothetical protein